MNRALLITVFALTLWQENARAQVTIGNFNDTLTFMGSARTLACYVPPSYDEDEPCRLVIGLHGMGDNAVDYRNGLVTARNFATANPNTILVCPDGGSDPRKDFYIPAGDEAIIAEAIAYASAHYSIDNENIVIQGFSLGGARALKYGLDNHTIFKGILLNTPAIQGVKSAVTGWDMNSGDLAYDNADKLPVYITHGNSDLLYAAPIDSLYEQLVRHHGKVTLKRFAVGHTVPDMLDFKDYISFFESTNPGFYDASIARVSIAQRTCGSSVAPTILVQNTGSELLSSIHFVYHHGAGNYNYTWLGSLEPQKSMEVTLPAVTAMPGSYTLEVQIDTLNFLEKDTVATNNQGAAKFKLEGAAASLPLLSKFNDEAFSEAWLKNRSGDHLMPWTWDEDTRSMFTINSIYIFNNTGRREELLSPVLDLTSISSPKLSFDVAHAYARYTASFFGIDTLFTDTLEIQVSVDCGESFESIYRKSGNELLTFDQPLINPANFDAHGISPSDADWRREIIDLSAYGAEKDVVLKFSLISGLGGITYLDNVLFANETTSLPELKTPKFSLFPNPCSDALNIQSGEDIMKEIIIRDMLGKEVLRNCNVYQSQITIPLNEIMAGLYSVEIWTTKGNRMVGKLTISH